MESLLLATGLGAVFVSLISMVVEALLNAD